MRFRKSKIVKQVDAYITENPTATIRDIVDNVDASLVTVANIIKERYEKRWVMLW